MQNPQTLRKGTTQETRLAERAKPRRAQKWHRVMGGIFSGPAHEKNCRIDRMFQTRRAAIGGRGVRSWFGVSFEWARDLKCGTGRGRQETPQWDSTKVWDRMSL